MPTINKPKHKSTYKKHSNATKIYNTSQWKKLRSAYLMLHPLCEMCLKNNITTPAEEVHHIKPILTGKDELALKDLAYNPDNLMALCSDCHHLIHKLMKL